MLGIAAFLYVIFITIAWLMTFYTMNFYYLCYQSRRNIQNEKLKKKNIKLTYDVLPLVTIQLPLYNEKYVAQRLIDAVCNIDYPKSKLEIQVLDDSDDDTVEIIESIVSHYSKMGYNIFHAHRTNRVGFKAGALKEGMKSVKGEFIAIFDADFIPPSTFLKNALGYFSDPKIGFVQCRWGHVNENYSSLTEAQAISLDLHFRIEQKAKSLTHLFMNFNGTAGIWRTSCIVDSGGWHTSTLVEDLDLSYRAQMRGWKCIFLEDVVVDAELPVQMNAAKRQQFRWAKGSMQVALKLLVDVAIQRKIPIDTKIQAFIQLTRHLIHPLFLVQFLIFPILLSLQFKLYSVGWAPAIGILIYVLMGPATYVYIIRKTWGNDWKRKAKQYFFLIFFATGISVNNTVAVFDGLFGRKNEFLRTPKFGITYRGENWKDKAYVLPFTKTTLLETFFAIYGIISIFVSIFSGNVTFVPILAIQTVGFIYIAYLSIAHSFSRNKNRSQIKKHGRNLAPTNSGLNRNTKPSDTLNTATYAKTVVREDQKNVWSGRKTGLNYQKLIMLGVLAFLAFGGGMAYYGYQAAIYPLDKAMGFLSRAQSAQTPDLVADYVKPVKQLIPKEGNPVWSFPTPRTDFGLIQNELDAILSRTTSLSQQEQNSAAYNTGLQDMHLSIKVMETNLVEATPYLYVSFSNITLSAVWISIILIIFAVLKRGRTKYRDFETT